MSVREIGEVAARALRAAGVSAGEAEYLAEMVTLAEVHEGVGLAALVIEVERTGGDTVPRLERQDDHYVLRGHDRRGPMSLFVPACETAAVLGRVVIPRIGSGPGLDWIALDVAERAGRSLAIEAVGPDGARSRVSVVTPGGTLLRHADHPGLPGLAIVPLPDGPDVHGDQTSTSDGRRERYREAVDHGVLVDGTLWDTAYSLSRGFLVPDNQGES